ncbi:MAG: DNA polymerase I, partial [Actinobacteria bacterium]|nr:DNA polymerase I [Actinomycetota bacterium]
MYDDTAVHERFGLPPEKLVDYAALKGDPSDNLPSVPGVGEKTASHLIQQFGSVESLYDRLDELPKKLQRLRGALEENRDIVVRNKRLSKLRIDLDVGIEPGDIRMGEWQMGEIRRLFDALQFRSLYERLPDVRASEPVAVEPSKQITVKHAEATLFVTERPRVVGVVLDEPSGGLALAEGDTEGHWVTSVGSVRELLEAPDVEKVTHDAKTTAVWLARRGITLRGVSFDTQIAAYLLDPAPGSYPLADISVRYLGRELPHARADEAQEQLNLGLDDASAAEAAAARATALLPLSERLAQELDKTGMASLMKDIELPLVDVLKDLELTGVAIDTDLLIGKSNELGARIQTLEGEIAELAGGPFNINSPKQLQAVLFDRLGLRSTRRTKTGPSTDAQALEGLRGQHQIIDALLEYRELTKLRSTYLDALPKLVDETDGRVHATFKQTTVATGRIATENPNLQNIPVRTELGREIRRAFIAGFPGHSLLVADYSQIELRVLAHITGDPGLTEAFERDLDVHAATAATVWGFDVDDVPRDLRERAKAINFGLAYGMNKFGLAQRLGITPDEAQEFIDGYFRSFTKVGEFMRSVVADAYRDGCTTTMLGRRRYLPELEHPNPRVRALGERQALNAPIQGSAADILKLAMIKVHERLQEREETARMVLTVHDELLFEVETEDAQVTMENVQSLMEQAYPLRVPLKVDAAVGPNWADAKP